MLSIKADDLWDEIADAETLRDDYLVVWRHLLSRWLGRNYRGSLKGRPTPENYLHGYMAFILPQLVWDYPVVQVEPERSAADTDMARLMELAVNFWIKRVGYRAHLAQLARDMLLGFGVSCVGYGPRDTVGAAQLLHSSTAMPALPCAIRVEPGDYFCDSRCRSYSERRFEGRVIERDYDDLLRDDRYDTEVLRKLTPDSRVRERTDDIEGMRHRRAERRTLTLYEVWLPERQLIVTLAESGRHDGPVVRTAEYYGPPSGPYQMWGVYDVPGNVYPLSPLAGVFDQFDELNLHALAAQKAARDYKKIGVYRRTNVEDGEAVRNARHGEFVGLTDTQSVQEMEVGGMTQQQVMLLQFLRERLDRTMGYSDAQRGQVARNTTATAYSIAQNNSVLRIEWLRQCLVSAAEQELRRVGWWFWNEQTIVINVVMVESGLARDQTIMGGRLSPEDMAALVAVGMMSPAMARSVFESDWVDYRLRIMPESLVKQVDPVWQKRMQDEWALAMQMSQIIGPQNINWVGLLDRIGDSYNTRNLSRTILMPQAMEMLQGGVGGSGSGVPAAAVPAGSAGPSAPSPGGMTPADLRAQAVGGAVTVAPM